MAVFILGETLHVAVLGFPLPKIGQISGCLGSFVTGPEI